MLRGILYGYRDDLDLNAKWWHRLASVVFGVCAVAALAFASAVVHQQAILRPDLSDVKIITTMQDVMIQTSRTERNDHLERFHELRGAEGIKRGDAVEPVSFSAISCFVATLIERKNGVEVENPEPAALCYDSGRPLGASEVNAADILKYELTPNGSRHIWLIAVLGALFGTAVASIVVLNLYYRGFIYVVCGPSKKAEDPVAP